MDKPKTEQQLREEVSGLIRELGVRHYSRHLIDAEIGQLNTRLVAVNTELYARQQIREAEAAESQPTEPSAEVVHE